MYKNCSLDNTNENEFSGLGISYYLHFICYMIKYVKFKFLPLILYSADYNDVYILLLTILHRILNIILVTILCQQKVHIWKVQFALVIDCETDL